MCDKCRELWAKDFSSFIQLNETCEAKSNCAWQVGTGQTKKTDREYRKCFYRVDKINVKAAEHLLEKLGFSLTLRKIAS